jgi:hypothetical protein
MDIFGTVCISCLYIIAMNMLSNEWGGMAELVARPHMDPKVRSSNPRGPEYL